MSFAERLCKAQLFLPQIAALIVLGVLSWIFYARFLHPLAGIPGPFIASVTRLWYVAKVRDGSFDKLNRQLHKKFGPLVRIAPDEVSVDEPAAVDLIYGIKSKFTKTDFYPPWRPQGFDTKHVDQFTDTDEAHHASRRRLVNNIYSMSSVLESEEYIDRSTELLLENLQSFAELGGICDLGYILQQYTFDVLGELFFGGAFGFLESRSDHGRWIESLDTLMPIMVVLALLPKLYRPVFLVCSILSSPTRGALSILNGIADTAKRIVSEKQLKLQDKSSQQERRDILSKLFDLKSRRGEAEDYTIADIQYESHVSLFAGSDTTAIAMRAIVYQLMTHPEVEEKLLGELHNALQAGRLTVPARYADASKLPYFGSCVKEAMRLHASVGLPMPRHPPTQGCEISGHYFPGSKSVSIGINPAVIHYNEAIFGDDADLFKPERWLQDNASHMERHLLTFGAGTRTCIGKNISLSEIYKMLPQLLLKFKLELAYPERPLVTKDHWFHKQEGLDVKVSIR